MTNDWAELGVGLTPNELGEIDTTCIKCGGPAVLWRGGEDELKAHCIKCKKLDAAAVVDALRAAFKARQSTRDSQPKPTSKVFASKPLAVTNGHSNGHSLARIEDDPLQKQLSEDYEFSFLVKQWAETAGFRAIYPTNEEFNPKLVEQIFFWFKNGKVSGYEHLTEAEMLAKAQWFADGYAPIERRQEIIIVENFDDAVIANEEYLQRRAIVERLSYSQSISLTVGGKHHGKSTVIRTKALSIVRNRPFLGREVEQGAVIYAASSDEVAVARMELLRMGWNNRADPLYLVHIKTDGPRQPTADEILDQIAERAVQVDAIYIVLDMLFDFSPIKDEMSYAGTREAVGKLQRLADWTKAHVEPTHHSPKYMLDTASAATAALGSQGIAARFSPITLSRMWGPNLYSVESTMTRDPRGLAIPQTCVKLDEDGWAQSAGEFEEWMKWTLYVPKIMNLFKSHEMGTEFSVQAIAQELELARPHAQNALFRMWKEKMISREKKGRSFRYFLADKPELFSQPDGFEEETPESWRGSK